jgi:hypothetical protein
LFKEGLNLEIKRLLRVKSSSELAQNERILKSSMEGVWQMVLRWKRMPVECN